jgi:hypothetical protein
MANPARIEPVFPGYMSQELPAHYVQHADDYLGDEIGPEFNLNLYRTQLSQLDKLDSDASPGERLALSRGLNRDELAELGKKYPDILDWSDLGDYRGTLDRRGLLVKAGKAGMALAAPLALYGAIAPDDAEAAPYIAGMVVIRWCDGNPRGNISHFNVYYIEDELVESFPATYDPDQGGDVKANWDMIPVPFGPTYFNFNFLNPGKAYHFRATAVDINGNESGLSPNQPIGVARLIGNVDSDSVASTINRVDTYDINMFRNSPARNTVLGNANFNPYFDFNDDGIVDDANDYALLKRNYGVIQSNEFGNVYDDDSRMVEFGECSLYPEDYNPEDL